MIHKDEIIIHINLEESDLQINKLLEKEGIKSISAYDLRNGTISGLRKNGWSVRKTGKTYIEFIRTEPTTIPTACNPSTGYLSKVIYGVNSFLKATVFEITNGLTCFFLPGYHHTTEVALSGDFNNWSTSNDRMVKVDNGWEIKIELQPGKHLYKFIIDGKWHHDLHNMQWQNDGYGGSNSIYFKYNYTFRLKGFGHAKQVWVSGSFNNWKENQLQLFRKGDEWIRPLYLNAGEHLYKFIVDTQWIPDPANKLWQQNEFGTGNSVLRIKKDGEN